MKEIDDTNPTPVPPLPESESEMKIEHLWNWCRATEKANDQVMVSLVEMINDLTLRVARLETQRTPQDENDDPEWF